MCLKALSSAAGSAQLVRAAGGGGRDGGIDTVSFFSSPQDVVV